MTTMHTAFGKVRTGSHRRFITVVAHTFAEPRVHSRSDTRATLETRLRREGFFREVETGLFVKREPGRIIDGIPTPGARLAAAEIIDTRGAS